MDCTIFCPMKRLFAAIKIEPSAEFTRLATLLSQELKHDRINWVELKNIHLTLKFFGETDENQIPAIRKALGNAASQCQPFTLQISRTGIFGSRYEPRVIWFGLDASAPMNELARLSMQELSKAGWEADRQNFVPHLTIGRIKEIRDKQLFQQVIDKYRNTRIQDQPVGEIILYESILMPQGPTYIKLATFPLAKTL